MALGGGPDRFDSSRRLLLVEDNPVNQHVMVRILTKLGYHVEVAENGAVALEIARTTQFAAIFMDCEMPIMDGYTATVEIRKLPGGYGDVPIIAATAYTSPSDIARCNEVGMNDVIGKPVRKSVVAAALDRWIRPSCAA